MNVVEREADLLRMADRLSANFNRGIITAREAVNKLTDELANHARQDLISTMTSSLPADVLRELVEWSKEVLQPDYEYHPLIIGRWPSEEYRCEYVRRMQPELVALARLCSGLASK